MDVVDPLLMLAIATGIFLVLLVGARLITGNISRRWNRHKAETVDKWNTEGVEYVLGPIGGQFGGLESMGVSRVIRGIGFVAITSTDVRVTRSTPSAAWCISFRQIKEVTIQPAFLGKKSQKSPFVVIKFVQDNREDKLAFQVKESDVWAKRVAKMAKVKLRDQR